MKKVLILTGSNSAPDESINWSLAARISEKFDQNPVRMTGMNEHVLPMYQPGLENDVLPESVNVFGKLVRGHDALVIVSPEHNGLMPACLKNAIDWLSRTRQEGESFFGAAAKPVLLLSTSPGNNGGATNLKYMAELMPWWGGNLVGMHSVGAFYEKYQDGMFDNETEKLLSELAARLKEHL